MRMKAPCAPAQGLGVALNLYKLVDEQGSVILLMPHNFPSAYA